VAVFYDQLGLSSMRQPGDMIVGLLNLVEGLHILFLGSILDFKYRHAFIRASAFLSSIGSCHDLLYLALISSQKRKLFGGGLFSSACRQCLNRLAHMVAEEVIARRPQCSLQLCCRQR
jgi:hypothetical protein